MLPQEVIRRKRDGAALSRDEVQDFIAGLTAGAVSEGQVAAFAMAVFFKGMSREEAVGLTLAMRDSGTVLHWDLPGPVVDKHSSGGIGDNLSLMLAPMLAACGCYVPMISGRGLGHTGGTLDKLDSIPGYVTQPDLDLFRKVTREAGCAIIGQTADLAPADKRLYGIRDVTATVESIPLITASILSKKLAAGLEHLVLDVKMGSGAFMATHGRGRGPGRKPGGRGQWRGPQDHRAHHRHGRAAGALRRQCHRSGPCRGVPARPPGGAARHGDHAGARRRTAAERRDRPRRRSGHVTPAPQPRERRGGRALRPHGGAAGRAQGFPRPSRSHLQPAPLIRPVFADDGRLRSRPSAPAISASPSSNWAAAAALPPTASTIASGFRHCSARATSRIAQRRSACVHAADEASFAKAAALVKAAYTIGGTLRRTARHPCPHRSLIHAARLSLHPRQFRHRRRARCRSLRRRGGEHAGPHRRAHAAEAAAHGLARSWPGGGTGLRPRSARSCHDHRTLGLRHRNLARQGHHHRALGDRRRAAQPRLGLFPAHHPRLSAGPDRRAGAALPAAGPSRALPCLGHAGDRGFRRGARPHRQAHRLYQRRQRHPDRRA